MGCGREAWAKAGFDCVSFHDLYPIPVLVDVLVSMLQQSLPAGLHKWVLRCLISLELCLSDEDREVYQREICKKFDFFERVVQEMSEISLVPSQDLRVSKLQPNQMVEA